VEDGEEVVALSLWKMGNWSKGGRRGVESVNTVCD
jgi:hypothetical protein